MMKYFVLNKKDGNVDFPCIFDSFLGVFDNIKNLGLSNKIAITHKKEEEIVADLQFTNFRVTTLATYLAHPALRGWNTPMDRHETHAGRTSF